MHDDSTQVQDAGQIEQSLKLSVRTESPPAEVPGYRISKSLGEGAYGSVWLAHEQNTGKQVAIKFYSHHRGLDWSLLSREVEKLAVLYTSRNIVRLLEVGWDSDPPYYVMEYLDNGSLSSLLSHGPLPVHEAVRIAKSILQALVHAHGSGILHCDLKPANVLLDADFEPRLCDFGQSRLSDEQDPALGTMFYMAPEQADLEAVPDARWDVYALGALLHQMLTGVVPYRTPENEERIRGADSLDQKLAVYRKVLKDSPKPNLLRKSPHIDKSLADVVEGCLRIDPKKRYTNAQVVLDKLLQRDRQRARRPLIVLGVVGPGLLLLAMASLVYNVMQKSEQDARSLLTERALESDLFPAKILALSLERDLEDRRQELKQVARDPTIQLAIPEALPHSSWAEREQSLKENLLKRKRSIDESRAQLGRPTDRSWFLTNPDGVQRWRDPYSPDSMDNDYSKRDYYLGLDLGGDINDSHISEPFRSDATKEYMVAITVPVWSHVAEDKVSSQAGREVTGVLGRTADLGSLLDYYIRRIHANDESPDTSGDGQNKGRQVTRVAALVEFETGQLLDHPWLASQGLEKLTDDVFEKLRLPAELIESLQHLKRHRSEQSGDAAEASQRILAMYVDNYVDPASKVEGENAVYGGEWLAAFALIPGTNWATIVQERKDEAQKPVDEMKVKLMRSGLGALLASCALIGLLWYFVGRALLGRRLQTSSARNGSSRSTGTLSTTTNT